MRHGIKLVLLGDPVGHSRSPAIHRAAMEHLGVSGSYEAVRAGVAELEAALRRLQDGELDGANVTMPLKGEAASRCDLLTEEARAAGSVNTLRSGQVGIEGHSTDLVAVRTALDDSRFPPDAPLLVLGAGGAAAAAVAAAGGRTVHVSARSEEAAESLLGGAVVPGGVVPFGSPVGGAIVANATPVGMQGETLPGGVLAAASGLIDLPYGSSPTGSVRWAEAHGLPCVDGVEFLVLQAAESFRWWTGLQPPLAVMLAAARNA